MRITYYKTSSFIQHTGSIIDLAELRRRQAAAQRDSLARQPESVLPPEEPDACGAPGFRPVVLTMSQSQRRRARQERRDAGRLRQSGGGVCNPGFCPSDFVLD